MVKETIESTHAIGEETWKTHLRSGDPYDERDNGFSDTPIWENQKAKHLLFEVARIAASEPFKISLGQQYPIKERLIKSIMAVISGTEYDESAEAISFFAEAIFKQEVLMPLQDESPALFALHTDDIVPPPRPLAQTWEDVRWMNQEEVEKSLPRIASHEIALMTTLDRVPHLMLENQAVFLPILRALLFDPTIKHIVMPICSHAHWQAVHIQKIEHSEKKCQLTLFDSSNFEEEDEFLSLKAEMEQLMFSAQENSSETAFYQLEFKQYKVKERQTDGAACGYFVVAFIHQLMRSLGVSPCQEEGGLGYDKEVADSLQKGQREIERSVTTLHDARLLKKTSAPFESHQKKASFIPMMPSTLAIVSSKLPPQLTSPAKSRVGKALGLSVLKKKKEGEDTMENRVDIKALKDTIKGLDTKSHAFFSYGYKQKGMALRRACNDYIRRLKHGDVVAKSIVDDALVAKVIDKYRYFGFFYRTIEKWTGNKKITSTRKELETLLAHKPL
jgi:hypothetical protein